ncbi:neutral cholesterol ester hydrolase 1-like [Mercenaria mercenaria]|uniref:neutral cholesterol ester hydrolase 1-like n=1 Tax=Mercenaria mercenaria TaxID=6596 RepID=UPI001E1D46DF|nr:neutral cholesterol ester hydrolase 1-like [Mercenaria mercenaria]
MGRSKGRLRRLLSLYSDNICSILMKTSAYRRYCLKMARVAFWAVLVILVALFISYYLDTPVPEDIPEQLTVKIIDASMRTYKHLIDGMVKLGLTNYFSPLDRKIADWFILAQMTGQPWGLSLTADQTLRINDTRIAGVRVVLYEPVSTYRSDDRPVLIFMHGGGWSTMSVDSYDPLIRKISRESGVVIISINYRLSPEFPYPAPLEDCIKVVKYVTDRTEEFRIDPFRVAIGGDSAGGNMAASIALHMREVIAMQFLIVPCLQFLDFKTTSFVENTYYFHDSINNPLSVVFVTNYLGVSPVHYEDFLKNNHTSLTLKRSQFAAMVDQRIWMKSEYVRNKSLIENLNTNADFGNEVLSNRIEKVLTDPFAAPLMANDSLLGNLPEAYIVTCGYDFIRDDGVMYAERLNTAGTKVIHRHYRTGFHHAWFFPHGPLKIGVAVNIVSDLVKALRKRL